MPILIRTGQKCLQVSRARISDDRWHCGYPHRSLVSLSDARLGKAASSFIDDAVSKGNHIGVSAISIAAIADRRAVLRRLPLDHEVAAKMAEILREDVPDLSDRVIAATGLFYRVPVLSRDSRIKASAIQTIW